MSRRLAAAAVVVLATVGCAPEAGEVVGRDYDEAYTYITEQCSYTTLPNGQSTRSCVPVTRYADESYRLRLDDGEAAGWRSVPAGEYDRCHVGDHYPDCARDGD
ncbi:hypothetical protein [Nocardiopsis sp. FR26]|uniref:hypothetical protein n=1 Tax=Nocardiopsis sp. FR26 TaxID=2605987 RepID=UPI001359FCAF|nr:hypothetical protein [Nocardiopsis sp. FR26]